MAQFGYHEVKALSAQVTPGIAYMPLDRRMIDRPLLDALLRRWREHFGTDSRRHENVALFRSLNMALSASMLPGNVEVTVYDIGKTIALWVSAFEILAHPGTSGVGFKQVYQLLERVGWKLSECRESIYQPYG